MASDDRRSFRNVPTWEPLDPDRAFGHPRRQEDWVNWQDLFREERQDRIAESWPAIPGFTPTPPAAPPTAPPAAPPAAPPIAAPQQRQIEQAIAANFPKPKGKVRKERVTPQSIARRNLEAFRRGVVQPAQQWIWDAAKATGQQLAEEGLKVLFGKIFKVGKVVKGTEIVLRMAQEMRKPPKKPGADFKQLREELGALRDRMAGYGFPVPKPPTHATPKPPPPRPAAPLPKSKPAIGFPTRYAAPVTMPGAQSPPRPIPAPAPAPARPVMAPARPGAPLPGQSRTTPPRGQPSIPASRPAPRTPARPTSQPVPRPVSARKPSSRPSPLARVLASLPAPAQFLRPPSRRPAPRPVSRAPAPRPFTPPLTAVQPTVLPLAASGFPPNRPPSKTKDCRCDKKPRKIRPPRTVCYRGTYVETARGLIKTRKEQVPCPPSKLK